jgi:hypothetical protein
VINTSFNSISVNSPATITNQPVSLSLNSGGSASFSVSAIGLGTLAYQWRKNGVSIPGATAAIYSIPSVSTINAAAYSVVVGNIFGKVTSADAILSINGPAAIVVQPVSLSVNSGKPAVFSVGATGTAPISYQWRKNGLNISNATSASYSIPAVSAGDAANYDVQVSNAQGSVASGSVSLSINAPPSILVQPSSIALNSGTLGAFTVTATGTSPINYQWRKNGVNIIGANSPSFSISPVTTLDAGSYDVVVSNIAGSVNSGSVALSVNTLASITAQPASVSPGVGGSAQFSVLATGNGPLTYQWKKNGSNIPGATASTYTLNSVSAQDEGSYSVLVTNLAGTVNSATALQSLRSPLHKR